MTIQVSMVPRQYVDTCWDKVEPFLEKAAKYTYGRYTVDDIKATITDYDYDLWVAFEGDKIQAAVVTNFVVYPKRKLLCMAFCGGENMTIWLESMLALLRKYAAEMGCDGLEATARRGWGRVFKNDGYDSKWVTFELPLEGA